MSKLSTVAWVAHNLGLSAWFAGTLFGKLAPNLSVKAVDSKVERGKVLNSAWNRYNAVNAASSGVAAGTWVVGRTMLSGAEIGEDARNPVLAKDVGCPAEAPAGRRRSPERGQRGGREPGPNRAVGRCKLFAGRPELLALALPFRSSWAREKHPPSRGQRRRVERGGWLRGASEPRYRGICTPCRCRKQRADRSWTSGTRS
jgi:hypothetical protein